MDECSNLIYDETGGNCDMGQSDSKGARSKRSGASGGRGAAMSFGFRGRKAGAKGGGAPDAGRTPDKDKNGNGGSTEELFTGSPVMSGRSTPLARPRKEASGQPLRTNRFGFRQNAMAKTAKVADINMSAEQALSANHRDLESKNNNFISDKIPTRPSNVTFGLIPTQISPNGIANITSPPKPTQTKQQTVILTYSAKQYPSAVPNSHNLRSKSPAIPSRVTPPHNPNPGNQRSASASRAYTTSSGYDVGGYKIGNLNKYTMQTNQLPKPQYPSVKLLDSKSAKQVANNTRKGYGSSEGSSKEGSMTEDSGVGVDVDPQLPEGGWSPRSSQRQHRRPRTLEMVMRGEHSFHLRELQVSDLDIMVNDFVDEAIVTDVDVIPLPKLPSTFDKDNRPDLASEYPPTNRFSRLLSSIDSESQSNRPGFSTLERYRNNRERDSRTDNSRTRTVPDNVIDKEEEKVCRDRLQREKNEKQDCMKMSSNSSHSPLASKESSPSAKSEESHHSVASGCSDPMEAWMNHTAGESMALRSNDEDISAALSLSSSCDEEKGFNKSSGLANFTQTRVDIVHNEPRDYAKLSSFTAHPMMLKSLTLSQTSNIQSMLMSSSMSSSAFSGNSDSQQFTLLTEDPKAALAALALSNQSLIDDETSPADSLISSSSESNNEMPVLEKDATMSSSAYHTADNKNEEDKQEEEEKEVCEENNTKENGSNEKSSPQNKSPHTPGTPSHSLSLSEGRDFLIDDEIADQPALMFEANSTAEQMTSSLQLIHLNATDHTVTLQDPTESPLVTKKNKGLQNSQKMFSSPLFSRRAPPRSPSLDTLSPCDSIASDDLICDMDFNHSLTSLNSQDEYIDRLDSSIRSGLNSLEDSQLREELMKYTINHKRQLNNAMNSELSQNGTPTKHQGQSMTASNSSIANIGAALPVRTRLLSRSRAPTPEVRPRAAAVAGPGAPPPPPDEGALRLERAAHGCMQQDIVAIKAMLHKLKRVLQEPDEGHNMMRTETLNPLGIQRDQTSCPLKNGPSLHLLGDLGEASPPPPPPEPHEEVADLRRQLVFLQSQLEERERMVKLLQQQMSKISQDNSPNGSGDHSRCNGTTNIDDMCNVATQTERLRPLSQGQNLLHNLASDSHSGGMVSWNEQRKPSKLSSPSDINHPQSISTPRIRKQLSSSINSPNTSDCEKTIPTPHNRSINSSSFEDSSTIPGILDSCVQVKTNCRIGSRYLQAIASKQSKLNKESPPCERSLRSRSLYSSRSKSIENFQHHSLCNTDNNTNGFKLVSDKTEPSRVNHRLQQNGSESRSTKHHTSHTNIFNGITNGNNDNDFNYFKVNGNLHNGYGNNGNLTDTDENSDSGYKSLPPVIGLSIANKVSGIPRRSTHNELRFSSSKQAQTNKC